MAPLVGHKRQRSPTSFSGFISPAPPWVNDFWDTLVQEVCSMAPTEVDSENEAAGPKRDVAFSAEAALLEPLYSLEEGLATYLGSKLETPKLPSELWARLLQAAFSGTVTAAAGTTLYVSELVCKDLQVAVERDPACPGVSHALLFFKGFHGLAVHRAASWLWRRGRCHAAYLLQSRMSEVFAMDIHPAATLEEGIFIDHATGLVIGETAVVGSGCTLLHGVTLGGTGKDVGDRHPKLGRNVLVGAGASLLGRVHIGDGAKIGAAALVLTDIPAHATAVGAPAKVVGRARELNPASKLDHSCSGVKLFNEHALCPWRDLAPKEQGLLGPYEFAKYIESTCGFSPPSSAVYGLFFDMDTDHDGQINPREVLNDRSKVEEFVNKYRRSSESATSTLSVV
eukprot:SM000209S06385  [mRNA]  locus=s209:213480:215570:- [translate_table: standard]